MPTAAAAKKRTSRSRSPRVRPSRTRFYYLKKRDGRYLVDITSVPFTWAEHGPRLAFRSREAADAFAQKRFLGRSGVSMAGVSVVED